MCEILSTIDWRFIATVSIPSVIVVASWFVGHALTLRRDLASRKRETLLKALEAFYTRISSAHNRPLDDKSMDDLETFVAEIQLYGTPRQIQLMNEIAEGLAKPNNVVSYDPILADLRDTIRKELNLEPVSGLVRWLRMSRSKTQSADPAVKTDVPA